jgi:hypothetical protein
MAIPFRGPDVRLAVLEEKLGVYEELSKEMLAKLETAVDKISEANQNVAKILVRHEERLDQTIQSDNAIMKLLEELKKSHEKDTKEMDGKMNIMNTRIDELSKFRWIFAGILLVVGIVAGQVNVLESMFPQPPSIHSQQ